MAAQGGSKKVIYAQLAASLIMCDQSRSRYLHRLLGHDLRKTNHSLGRHQGIQGLSAAWHRTAKTTSDPGHPVVRMELIFWAFVVAILDFRAGRRHSLYEESQNRPTRIRVTNFMVKTTRLGASSTFRADVAWEHRLPSSPRPGDHSLFQEVRRSKDRRVHRAVSGYSRQCWVWSPPSSPTCDQYLAGAWPMRPPRLFSRNFGANSPVARLGKPKACYGASPHAHATIDSILTSAQSTCRGFHQRTENRLHLGLTTSGKKPERFVSGHTDKQDI